MDRPLRPLLPTTPVPASSPPPGPPATGARNSRGVCDLCRQRKVKCDGARPACKYCAARRASCRYSTHEGEKPRDALKRKYSELLSLEDPYARVFTALRDRPEAEAAAIFRRLRQADDVRSLARYIEQGDLLLQMAVAPETRYRYEFPLHRAMPAHLLTDGNHYLESLVYEWNSCPPSTHPGQTPHPAGSTVAPPAFPSTVIVRDPYLKPYHAARLVSPHLERVQPSKWTTVSTDDKLLRTILGAYFLQDFSWYTTFQPQYFIEDMAAMRTDCCSPLLVNALLAVACSCFRGLRNRAEYWNPSTLGYRFCAEARRLWDIEEDRDCLTTIQAAILLNIYYGACGLDKIGWVYTQKAVKMAYNMDLFRGCPALTSKRMRDAAGFTAWALFSWQSLVSFHFYRAPLLLSPPSVPLPDAERHPEWYGELWLLYPACDVAVPASFGLVFKAKCEFRVIMNDLAYSMFCSSGNRAETGLTIKDAIEYRVRLRQWERCLPPELSARRIVLPAHLMLHMHNHLAIVSIFTPFMQSPHGTPTSKAPHSQPRDSTEHPKAEEKQDKETPQETYTRSKVALETLARLYYLRHGYEHQDTVLVTIALSCCLLAIDDVTRATEAAAAAAAHAAVAAEAAPPANDDRNVAPQAEGDPSTTAAAAAATAAAAEREISARRTAAKSLEEGLRSTILLMAKCVYEQGQSVFIARAILHVLRRKIPPELLRDLWQYARDEERGPPASGSGSSSGGDDGADGDQSRAELERLDSHRTHSEYPVDIVNVAEDPESKRLTVALRQGHQQRV